MPHVQCNVYRVLYIYVHVYICTVHVALQVWLWIACAIIVFIFMAQRFGTSGVGACFAPIVLIYFLCNLIIAITNISRYKPTIFKVNIYLDLHC